MSGTRRALLLGGAALAANTALAARLWQLQVVESDTYRAQAAQNRARTRPIQPLRGLIYDRNRTPLVANAPVFSVWLTPADLPLEREGPVLANLAVLTGERLVDLRFKLNQARLAPDVPARLARAVPRESALTIEERRQDLPGIAVRTGTRREYAHGDVFGHILGFTGPIPAEDVQTYRGQGVRFDEDIGLAGIERSLQTQLRGRDGEQRLETDAFGRALHELSFTPPQVGRHAVLTIAVNEQKAIREILARHLALRERGAGAVVVLRPDTGDVVAMVSLPDYDSNIFTRGASSESFALLVSDPRRPLINHAISGLYPPGSTYKVIAASGALEAGVVLPQSKIHCDGRLILPDGWAFDDWLPQGHGLVDLERAIAESCNIYFYNVSGGNPYTRLQGLGNRRLAEFERSFGFGQRTGIDLPGEASGLVPTSEWKNKNLQQPWVTGDTYHAAIGQGLVQVTPLQIASMYAAIGNGGRVMRPRLVDRMLDHHGNVADRTPPQVRGVLPISDTNLQLLQAGLYRAVNEPQGTGPRARSAHTVVAGKTGTAEYSGARDAEGRLPSHAWFAGYAPAEQPEYAFAVLVRDGGEGSFAAAPIARDIVDYLVTGDMPPLPQNRPDFISPDHRL
ncbi:MAG: penicillin-binding protein 2 [Chloroflexi bacterium]|nr:penicillin-binding protein 2 [Chloroflexota bacterium]